MMDWLLQYIVLGLVVAGLGALLKWFIARNERSVVEIIGETNGVSIAIVTDEDRDFVGVTFRGDTNYMRVLLSPQQALVLADWLRIAGSKGKTVKEARVNYRRSQTA